MLELNSPRRRPLSSDFSSLSSRLLPSVSPETGRGGFGRGRGDRGRGRGRPRGRPRDDDKEWVPVTKLGRLVKENKIKSLEDIYLFSMAIKGESARKE